MSKKVVVLNAQGNPIVLNEMEQRIATINQRKVNALGFEVDITTMTTIMKKVSEQKFYNTPFADYVPVKVGEGAWSTSLTTYRSFSLADAFDTGVIGLGGNNGKLASGDAGVDAMNIPVNNWAKTIGWTIFDLQAASRSGNWDLVSAKEKSRKTNWDLGIQAVAFLGMGSQKGLLNQAGVTVNTALITKALSLMTAGELSAFCALILNVYRANCNRTCWPSHFVMPESDYLGLASPSSADFPLKSKMAVLLETFQIMTGNAGFKILPSAYAEALGGKQRYALYNYEEESIRMDIPVDYTSTLANSIDNFSFQNVGYGQFTGVLAYRPLEIIYFEY